MERVWDICLAVAAASGVIYLIALFFVPNRPWKDTPQGLAMFFRELISASLLMFLLAIAQFGLFPGWRIVGTLIFIAKAVSLPLFYGLIFIPPQPTPFLRRRVRRDLEKKRERVEQENRDSDS